MKLSGIILILAVALALPELALAQTGWEEPATDFIETLEGGLVRIGSFLIGIGVIAFGAYAAITGRMEWSRFIPILVGGILIMAGPAMIKALLGA